MYQTILAAVDGSDAAKEAAQQATELADAVGATLHVLYVIERRPAYTRYGISGLESEEAESEIQQYAEEVIGEVADLASGHDIEYVTEIKKGTPHSKIIEYAETIDADAIVLGKSGWSGLEDIVLGSTADRVARKSGKTIILAE